MSLRSILAILIALALPGPAAADALRCGSRLVATEATAAEVLGACGEPALRDNWWMPHPTGNRFVAETEEWTYDFGASQLLRILRFRNGRLVAIESDGYGFDVPGPRACAPSEIVEGLGKYRLLERCGEPMTREAQSVFTPLTRGTAPPARLQSVYRERWVYNFGGSQFLREVTLENGRVSEVDTGARGFDPR